MYHPTIDEQTIAPYDVIVIGGGMAGITATIAAARQGAKTLLVEKAGWLGGMGFTGATGLHSFFNIFDVGPGYERQRVVAGLAQELVDRVQALGGGLGHVHMERGGDFVSMLTPVEPETAKLAAIQLILESGAEMWLHTTVTQVKSQDGHVEGVVAWNKGGRFLLRAKVYIDASGDGDIAAYAGAPVVHFAADDPGAYSAGFTFRLCNIDLAALEADLERRGLITQLAHAVKPGMTEPDLVRLGINMRALQDGAASGNRYFLSSSLRPRELTYCNCINYGPNDGLDATQLTAAENALRAAMFDIAARFRSQFDGCADCYVAGPAPTAGQRRSRAIRCEYELSEADCTEGRQFDDQIALFGFIDNSRYLVRDGGAYGIPYGALLPRNVDNLLIAGRMMTVDTVAHNSTRNTVCCLACGQAAGTAAALAAAQGKTPKTVDTQQLQEQLRQAQALLQPKSDPL